MGRIVQLSLERATVPMCDAYVRYHNDPERSGLSALGTRQRLAEDKPSDGGERSHRPADLAGSEK
jgi:hypothetical protein